MIRLGQARHPVISIGTLHFQDFLSACVAILGKGSIASHHALITNACKLKNRSSQVRLGYIRHPYSIVGTLLGNIYKSSAVPALQFREKAPWYPNMLLSPMHLSLKRENKIEKASL